MKYYQLTSFLVFLLLLACKKDKPEELVTLAPVKKQVVKQYGYVLDDCIIERDTVKSGDSFGKILFNNKVGYPTIQNITDSAQGIFDVRRIQVGKPYVLLKTKDTVEAAQVFIYEKNKEDYVVIDFKDKPQIKQKSHPVTYVEKELSGVIFDNPSSCLLYTSPSPRDS